MGPDVPVSGRECRDADVGDGAAGSQAEPTGRVVVSQCGRMWSEGEAATGRREVSALVRSRISIYKERERGEASSAPGSCMHSA